MSNDEKKKSIHFSDSTHQECMVFARIGHGSYYHHWNEIFAGVLTYQKNTKKALEQGEAAYLPEESENLNTTEVINVPNTPNTSSTSSALDLRNYNPKLTCSAGYINNIDVWVPDPCFYPVFVYRFGNIAQVNSQNELDSYLQARWSLTKEKTYTSIGPVPTQNYTPGVNSPVNGLPMPSNANNSIVIGIKNDNNVRARPQSGPESADAVVEVLVEGGMTRFINIFY